MKNKKIIAVLMIFAAVLLMGAGALLAVTYLQPEDLVLNNMQIILPAEPTDIEQTAAKELNTYFGKITGRELPVINEGDAQVTAGIYIGNTQFASANNVTYPEAQFEEGWTIKAVNGNLVLTGGAGRGVLYSVFHLLEDYMGVRWWTYWEEYVPTMAEVRLSGKLNVSGKPVFAWREIHAGRTAIGETNLFCVRNRLNGDTSNAPAEYGGEEAFGLLAHVHTFNRYFDINDFKTNPEWFAYVGGGRSASSQLCLTNQELVEEMSKRVLNSIERSFAQADAAGTKRPLLYDVSPNDMEGHCCCEACLKARNEKGLSGVLLNFVNQVAENVGEVYPEVFIETLAYANYVEMPLDDTKPADNVVIRLCIGRGLNKTFTEETQQNVKHWSAITKTGQLYIWDYCVFYNNPGVAPTVLDYSENFQLLHKLGINGYFGEHEDPIMNDFWDMKFWLNAKLMEDPYQDQDKLVDDFLTGYYGAAAPYLLEYLQIMNKQATAYVQEIGFTTDMKAYKADPTAFPGTVADISTFVRQAVTGKTNSPDLYTVMQILGYARTVARIKAVMENL